MNVNATLIYLKRSVLTVVALLAVGVACVLPSSAWAETVQVEEGVYAINSALSSTKALDVTGASMSNGTNIQLYDSNESYAQYWRVVKSGEHYQILNSLTGMALDVASAGKSSGTNVQLYEANDTNAQLWDFVKADDGSYYIQSVCNGLMLDVTSASTSNGTNVQVYSSNETKAQKWTLSKLEKSLEEGVYTISSGAGSAFVLDVASGSTANGAAVQIYSSNNSAAQKWQVSYSEETGFYTILSAVSGKALDIPSASSASGTKLQQYTANGTSAQAWRIVENSDGSYTLYSVVNGYAIDVPSGQAKNANQVQMYVSNSTAAQKWTFTETNLINDGLYQIASSKSNNAVLDVSSASLSTTAKLQVYSKNGTLAQKWSITAVDGGYAIKNANSGLYLTDAGSSITHTDSVGAASTWTASVSSAGGIEFTNVSTGKVIDLQSGNTASGTKVQPYSSNGTAAQAWLLQSATLIEEGYYTIANRANTNLVLDVESGSTSSGANVQVYQSNGTGAQIWWVEDCGNGYYTISNAQSELPLDVVNGSTTSGTSVQQYSSNGTSAQQWSFSLGENGGVVITSKLGNLSLTAESVVSGGDAVIKTTDSSSSSFAWSFTATEYVGEDIETSWSSSYVDSLRSRAQSVGSNTNWIVITDISSGRVAVFNRSTSSSKWALVRAISNIHTSSNTFRGTFTLCHKTRALWENGIGINDYFSCYVDDFQSSRNTRYSGYYLEWVSDCINGKSGWNGGQGFHYGYSSGGCVAIESLADSKYIYDNVPTGSRVVNF